MPKLPWTGFEGTNGIAYRIAKDLGLNEPRGIVITYVYPESPAKKAGLQIGDVILKADNKTITDFGNLPAYIANEKKVGQSLNLTVFRNAATLPNASKLILDSAPEILTFEDPNNGIGRIQFPSEWTKVMQTEVQGGGEGAGEGEEEQRNYKARLTLSSPIVNDTDKFQERVVLTIDDTLLSSLPDITLDQYLDAVINSYKQELGNFDFKLIDSDTKNVKLSGNPTYMFVYNYTDPDFGTIQQREVGTMVDDKLFYFTYLAQAERYPEYLNTVQDIINSFQIIEEQVEETRGEQEEGEEGEEKELIGEIGNNQNFVITASGKSVNLSKSDGYSENAAVSASGNNVYVVWNDNSTGRSDIYFTKSTNGGVTFGTPQNLNAKSIAASGPNNSTSRTSYHDIDELDLSHSPNIFSLGDNLIYITWAGKIDPPSISSFNKDVETNYDIFFTKSQDGGSTFSKPINLSNNYGISTLPQLFAVYNLPLNLSSIPQSQNSSNNNTRNASNNTVYVIWEDNSPLNNEIYLAISVDGGSTFGKPINVSNNGGDSRDPSITVASRPFDTTTNNNTSNVGLENIKDDNTTSTKDNGYNNNNTIYVAWEDTSLGRTSDILISNSIDGGSTFSKPVRLPVNSTQIPSSPSVVAVGGLNVGNSSNNNSNNSNNSNKGSSVYVIWKSSEIFEDRDDIYLAQSADGGKTFTNKIVNISNGTGGDSFSPSVAVISSGSEDIGTLSAPANESILASSEGLTGNASAEGNNSLYVVWEEDLSSDPEVFLSQSSDGGITFSNPINLSNNTGNSFSPNVAAVSSSSITGENEESVYIVWNDSTSANSDILFSFFSRSK